MPKQERKKLDKNGGISTLFGTIPQQDLEYDKTRLFEGIGGSNESGEGSQLKRLGASGEATTKKNGRLVHWMTDVLSVYMTTIVSASVID